MSRLCRCKTDLFAFPQPPRPPISPEKSLIPSSDLQPPSNRSRRSPRSTPRPRPLVVCTRKRRGDGKHVCAMRTGIGVSLFRGGSDVLFHPRRRQSCRTAKTYHTIVSKFAHSLISLALIPLFPRSSFSLCRLLRCPRRLFTSLYLVLFYLTASFYSFSTSSSTSRLLLFIVAILSLVHLVSGRVSWYAPAKFSVCAPDWKTSREMRLVSFTAVGIAEMIVENDLKVVMCEL